MAQTVTAAGRRAPNGFPFVRVPMYEIPGSHARKISGVEHIAWQPLVKQKQRDEWATFVREQQDWYDESKDLGNLQSSQDLKEYDLNSTMREYIWIGNRSVGGVVKEAPAGRLFAPIFQCSPAPYSPLFFNYDMMSEWFIPKMLPSLRKTRSGLMTKFSAAFADPPDSFAGVGFQDSFHDQYSTSLTNGTLDHPHSAFIHPVFEDLTNSSSRLVGFLSSIVAWDAFFGGLLPEGVSGIHAVLSNSCGQSFTYVLEGQRVRILHVRNH
jgi:hypothetical protein